jgi:hypothetical protein
MKNVPFSFFGLDLLFVCCFLHHFNRTIDLGLLNFFIFPQSNFGERRSCAHSPRSGAETP